MSFLINPFVFGASAPAANLAFEWYAETEGLSNGAAVGQLTDTSTNANHATQGTAGNKGTYVTGAVGGKASVSFDGSNDFYALTSAISSGQAFTIYAVYKHHGSGQDVSITGAALNGPNFGMFSTTRKLRLASHSQANTATTADTWNQGNISWQGSGTNAYAFRTNKADDGSGTTSNTSWSNAAEFIGALDSGAGRRWNGELAAVLIYTAVHDTTTKQTVESALSTFFGGAI